MPRYELDTKVDNGHGRSSIAHGQEIKNKIAGPLPSSENTHPLVVVVVVVVFTLTRISKSVLTGQAPVTLKMRKTTYYTTSTNHAACKDECRP